MHLPNTNNKNIKQINLKTINQSYLVFWSIWMNKSYIFDSFVIKPSNKLHRTLVLLLLNSGWFPLRSICIVIWIFSKSSWVLIYSYWFTQEVKQLSILSMVPLDRVHGSRFYKDIQVEKYKYIAQYWDKD